MPDTDTTTTKRSRPSRVRTKPRRPDDGDAEEPPTPTARHRPYPEPRSHKAKSKAKGKAKPRRSKKAAAVKEVEPEEDEEGEGEEEDGYGETDDGEQRDGYDEEASRQENSHEREAPLPQQRESYYPPSAHPAHYELESAAELTHQAPLPPPPLVVAARRPDDSPQPPRRRIGTLASLADGPEGNNARPPYPYSTLIRYAIEGSAKGKLTLAELYAAVEQRFPWFGRSGSGWKNSIRHNLSLNKSFVKVPRPLTEPGKGSYWCVNQNTAELQDLDETGRVSGSGHAEEDGAAPKKRRGRKKTADTMATMAPPPDPSPPVYETGHNGYTRYETSAGEYEPAAGTGYERYESPGERGPPAHGQETVEGEEEVEGERYDPGYYGHQHQHPYPLPPPPQESGTSAADGMFASEGYYHQPPSYPPPSVAPPEFVDDRPDRSAPRTIYNHAATATGPSSSSAMASNAGAGLGYGPPALGSLAASAPFGGYGSYGRFGGGYTSSLGGALGTSPSAVRDAVSPTTTMQEGEYSAGYNPAPPS